MDVGAEAFVVRRPEMPALLAELGLADRQIGTTGARPLIYSQDGCTRCRPARSTASRRRRRRWPAWSTTRPSRRSPPNPSRPLHWQPGADPAVADLVADRFGEQVVARSVDPMLGGVYAGSAATIGLRSAAPTLAAALDAGATSLTDAVRAGAAAASPRGPVFGAVGGGYRCWSTNWSRRSRLALGAGRGASGIDARRAGLDAARRRRRALACRRGDPGRSGAAAGPCWPTGRAAHRRGRRPDRQRVLGGAGAGGAARHRVSAAVRRAGGQRRTRCTPRRSRCRRASGGAAATSSCCGCRSAGSATTWPRNARPMTSCWPGRWTTWPRVFGLAVDPVDVHVQRWPDAMPQYGPGHRELVAELRAGLPPTLAVAGSYLDGIGVPACVGAAGRAACCRRPGRRNARGTIGAMARLDYDALNATVRYLMFSVFAVRPGELGRAERGTPSSTRPRPSSSSRRNTASWCAASTTSRVCGPTPTS